MIDVPYKVAGATISEFEVEAKVGDAIVPAKVPGVIIELVSDCGSMGHTFKIMTADPAATLAEFEVGRGVIVNLTPQPRVKKAKK